MSDAQKLINDVLRRHGLRCATHPECRTDTLAAEIDKALGGLTREDQRRAAGKTRGATMWQGSGSTEPEFALEVFPVDFDRIEERHRWVSGWSEAQP